MKPLLFEEWIDQVGVKKIAKKLKVHKATIHHWRAFRCDPKVDHMRMIKRWTRGAISYDQMIDRGKK